MTTLTYFPSLHTPQDMDIDDGEVSDGDPLPKASTKKKPPKPEENKSKKEHVNVVFIGHVGESMRHTQKKVECEYQFRMSGHIFQMLENPQSEDKSCR